MSRFRIKKQSLIAVAGIVWLLAGLNVAILGVRAAIDMRGVAAIVADMRHVRQMYKTYIYRDNGSYVK